ncbi:MAG: FAD-binding oxidoreductase [Acidimicrobiia bacterium]
MRAVLDPVLLRRLQEVVGRPHVLTDADVTAGYAVDWTGRFQGETPAVVRPGSTAEVAGVVAACASAGVAVVPQGGNTGLVGGGVPLQGEIVLSLKRLGHDTGVLEADTAAGQITAPAGATLAQVQRAAAASGWAYGVDWGSRDSATIGGSVATNAGGVKVLRYGDTRAQLLGVEAVLADGSVVAHLGGLVKDNTGYHLPSLLCGSEGTLAVVTAARLRLVPVYRERVVSVLAFDSVDTAVAATAELRRSVATLEACELFLAAGLELVCETTGVAPPFPTGHPVYLLVECADHSDPEPHLAEVAIGLDGLADVAAAVDGPRRADLWHYRDAHTEAINSLGPPHKLDVALPAAHLARFIAEVPAKVAEAAPQARCWLFGHAADGNIHVNVTGVAPDDDRVDDSVLSLVASMGGSISAEHGIGTAKKRWLHLGRSDAEITAFRRLKSALDPIGILNPNVLF